MDVNGKKVHLDDQDNPFLTSSSRVPLGVFLEVGSDCHKRHKNTEWKRVYSATHRILTKNAKTPSGRQALLGSSVGF